jgi:hypothetical protein
VRILSKLLPALLILVSFYWGACNDDPTAVGVGILPEEDFLRIDTLIIDANSAYTFDHAITTGNSGTIFVGEDDEFKALAILKLDSLLTLKGIHADSLRNAEIVEANLLLAPVYYLGDSTETISVEAYGIETGWITTNFNRDVYESLRIGSEIQSAASIMLGDTNLIVLPLSRELVQHWADLAQQNLENNGLVLKPTAAGKGIIGFSMLSLAATPSRLQIIHGSSDAPDTTYFFGFRRGYVGYNLAPIAGEDKIIFQGGVSTRSIIRFDLPPVLNSSLIHTATLRLTARDDQRLTSGFSGDSLQIHLITDPNKREYSDAFIARFDEVETDNGVKTVYSSRISRLVQHLVTVGDNKGFLIYDSNDYLGFHRTGFYTPTDTISERRPKLTIVYSPIQ